MQSMGQSQRLADHMTSWQYYLLSALPTDIHCLVYQPVWSRLQHGQGVASIHGPSLTQILQCCHDVLHVRELLQGASQGCTFPSLKEGTCTMLECCVTAYATTATSNASDPHFLAPRLARVPRRIAGLPMSDCVRNPFCLHNPAILSWTGN